MQRMLKNRTALIAALAGSALVALGWYVYSTAAERSAERIAALEADLAETAARAGQLETDLATTTEENRLLAEALEREQGRNEEFEDEIRRISRTVGTLDRLARTDKELLQKYSKVYFLNEHYVPERLSRIADEHVYTESREHYLLAQVLPYFEDMVSDAKDDGVDLWVVSAYRSFETQSVLKGAYTVTYGSGANAFSADQGYSEHQLGTAIDFTTTNLGGGLSGFENTPAYAWLRDHAHEYGFTLSYPPGNAYYVFEPWHWRFVGRDLAEHLHGEGKNFYDLDQRAIDEYLVSFFD